jgi:hypothetical protein
MQLKRPLSNFRDLGVVDLDLVDRPRGYGRCMSKMAANKKNTVGRPCWNFVASKTVIDILLPKIASLVGPKSH